MGHEAGQNVFGDFNSAFGAGAGSAVGTAADGSIGNSAFGADSGNLVTGFFNTATGFGTGGNTLTGGVAGNANVATGLLAGNSITGNSNIATGAFAGNFVTGNGNIAIGSALDPIDPDGTGESVTGSNNIAFGSSAGAHITASNTIAMGTNAVASANGSIAIGQGAVASQTNQVVLGTSSHTYTAPGITSAQSKARQSGPLEFVTSDANGNLATDGGQFFSQLNNDLKRIDENQSGVALAMAMQNPDLVGNERFGMAANYGNFQGASGLGLSLMGVLGNNFVTQNDRLAISGGVGVGFDYGEGENVVGGRVGLQWTR